MGRTFEEMQQLIFQAGANKREVLRHLLKSYFDKNFYVYSNDEEDEDDYHAYNYGRKAGDVIDDSVLNTIASVKPHKVHEYLKELAPSGQLLPTDIFEELVEEVNEIKKDLDYLETLKVNARRHKQETPES